MVRMRAQRGVGLLLAFLMLLGIMFSGLLLHDSANYFEQTRREQERQGQLDLQAAREALLIYMLLRADNPLAIAQGSATVKPRRLLLPCPDNVSDNNLDGSQEGGCRGVGSNIVNGILDSGSRFGRLPWRSRNLLNYSINDGLDLDTRDAAGNRFWYAMSRNMAPTNSAALLSQPPLNLHRLVTQAGDWLTVRNKLGGVVSNRVAAVILAPGPGAQGRLPESVLTTISLNYATDVAAAGAPLAPERYFESYTVGITQTIANFNTDGVFIQAPPALEQGFNDALTFISIRELTYRDHYFMGSYKRLIGISPVHNAPLPDRPLWQMKQALRAYQALFGFYPVPARQDNTLHVSTRMRACARYDSGAAPVVLALPASVTLAAAEPLTVSAPPGSRTVATVTLAQPGAFLLQQAVTATVAATVRYDDLPHTVAILTLARYARLTLAGGAVFHITAGGLTSLTATVFRLSAAVPVQLESAVAVTAAAQTPLKPEGALLGWLPEHPQSNQRAGNDGWRFTLQADTRAMFWEPAKLVSAALTVTTHIGEAITLSMGSNFKLEEDVATLPVLSGQLFSQDGRTLTITGMQPDAATFQERQFVIWLLADARRGTVEIEAPAVVFPWRHEIGSLGPNSRDNLLTYPPCLDTRNFFGKRLETAAEDQTVVYAVAEECHYGGDPSACGRQGGFTVSVAAGAAVALPQAVTVTTSFTVTVGNFLTVSVQNGTVVATANISLYRSVRFPLLATDSNTLAVFKLTAGVVMTAGVPLVLAAATPLTGTGNTVLEHVPALLLYSPAPLSRVACTLGMTAALAGTLSVVTLVIADQQTPAADITPLCYWLDDMENADSDNFYVIHPPEHEAIIGRSLSPRNDYFILLGGRLRM